MRLMHIRDIDMRTECRRTMQAGTDGDRMTSWSETGGFIPHGFCLSWDPDLMAAVTGPSAMASR
jgi:hypothetical protein